MLVTKKLSFSLRLAHIALYFTKSAQAITTYLGLSCCANSKRMLKQSMCKISGFKNKSANCRLVERHQRAISRFAMRFVDVSVMLGMALGNYFREIQ